MLRFWMAVWAGEGAPSAPPDLVRTGRSHPGGEESLGPCRYRLWLAPAPAARTAIREVHDRCEVRLSAWSAAADGAGQDDIEIDIDRGRWEIQIRIPLLSTGSIFYRREPGAIVFSNDPRDLARGAPELDPRGVYSLLQFGAIVPPFSMWESVQRCLPGAQTIVRATPLSLEETRQPFCAAFPAAGPPGDVATGAVDLRVRLDATLRARCPTQRPAILFSGGVDSGLIAARVAALGWRDALLVHYRRGPSDPESALAQAMAQQLGLAMIRVDEDAAAWSSCLTRLVRDYPQPFGDYSTLPTWRLVQEIFARAEGRDTVLDGTGADGAFGSFAKLERWRRLYLWPTALRRIAGAAYGSGRCWTCDGRWARVLGAARTSTRMVPTWAAIIAENPLDGIAYDAPASARSAVHAAIAAAIHAAFPDAPRELAARGLDLIHVVREMMAQKDAPLFLGSALEIVYPFLDPGLVRLGLEQSQRLPASESKAALKALLARQVPAGMVYRPKSGFAPPIASALRAAPLAAALQEHVIEGAGPLRPFLSRAVITRLARLAQAGRPLSHTSYNLLWTVLLTSVWLRAQEGDAATCRRGDA